MWAWHGCAACWQCVDDVGAGEVDDAVDGGAEQLDGADEL